MTQKDFDTEDTVICLDISRSMARKDFQPSRLEAVKAALISFVQTKHGIDKDDRFALVTFSTNAKINQELTNDTEQIISAIKNVFPQGISSLGEGLAVALHVVSDQILKQGANVNRVIVVSDGKPWLGTIDPLEKARIMGEVGVLVDAIQVATTRTTWGQNILESIPVLGEYHQATNAYFLDMTLRTLSHKKDIYELKKTTPKLHLIAADLLIPSDLTEELSDAIKHIKKGQEDKCVICRLAECGVCETTDCGRLCPYCKTYMHLCCAHRWSKESKMVEANVFRCPHCLFLLRLPEEATTRIPLKAEERAPAAPTPISAEEKSGEAKIGKFFVEHGRVKLVAKLNDDEKEFYLSWDNWGSRDFTCNIVSGINEIICKDFTPKIDWVERSCSGFILRDLVGWFSKPPIDRGVFLLDLNQFENWCNVILADVERIKEIIKRNPEIQLESDKLIDFEFIVEVNYNPSVDTTDRTKLDRRLLDDAIRYLQFIRTRPYFEIVKNNTLEIPKTVIEASQIGETSEKVQPQIALVSNQPTTIETVSIKQEEPVVSSIENPYTGQMVDLPSITQKKADIGTARTLAIPSTSKSKLRIQGNPKIEITSQIQPDISTQPVKTPQEDSQEKIKLRCISCQKWYAVEKLGEYNCPNCSSPLKIALQCEACKNWFSVSKPGNYNCPNCKKPLSS